MRATCRALAQLSPRTNKSSVALEVAALAGNRTAPQLNPTDIAHLLAVWKTRLSTPTQRTYSVVLRHILHWLNRTDLEDLVPKIRNPRSHPPTATDAEIESLMAVAPAWLRAYIVIGSQAALRRSDALALTERHIHDGIIHLIQFKTGQPVSIPASPAITRLVAALPPGDPATPILARIAGKPVTRGMLDRQWQQAKKKARVNPRLRPHSLRHTTAVKIYDATHDIRIVQQMLGHTALSTTASYLEHYDPLKLKPILKDLWTPKKPG